MNRQRIAVQIPPQWQARARQYGKDKVAHYASDLSPRSRSVSGDRGAERNPVMQAQGKLGEVAVALWLGRDPETVDWGIRDGDGGADLLAAGGVPIDVKTNFDQPSMYPSKDINHLLHDRRPDTLLVSVSIDDRQNWSRCCIEGWMTLGEFLRVKRISVGNLRLGEPKQPGTWFVDKAELHPLSEFPAQRPRGPRDDPRYQERLAALKAKEAEAASTRQSPASASAPETPVTPPRTPHGYTDEQRDAACADAERLGYRSSRVIADPDGWEFKDGSWVRKEKEDA